MTRTASVLVVDDNPGFNHAARTVLGDDGFMVHTAETGHEALAFLERRPPFLDAPRPAFVVLDFHLPDMDAPAVLRRLQDGGLQAIPVLVVSQADWAEDEAAARAAGARDFRVKPSRARALHDTLLEFWRAHGDGTDGPADRG